MAEKNKNKEEKMEKNEIQKAAELAEQEVRNELKQKKIERIKEIYTTRVENTPAILFNVLDEQKQRLEEAKAKHGALIPPSALL